VKDSVLQRFEQMIFSEDVQLGDMSGGLGCIGVYGPAAAALAGGVLGAELTGFGPFQNVQLERAGQPVVAARRDAMGLPGYLVFAPGDVMPGLAQEMFAAGAAILPPEVAETLRVEAGEPAFLVDMDADTIPTEAGIEPTAVSYLKGCFPGQEVLVRIRDRGHGKVARKLVGLSVDGDTVPAAGASIAGGGKEIGRVTSAVMSPTLAKPIALGYVHREFVEPGTAVAVVIAEAPVGAAVTELPFVR